MHLHIPPPYITIMLVLFIVPTFLMWGALIRSIWNEAKTWTSLRKWFSIATVVAFGVSLLMSVPVFMLVFMMSS